MTWDIESSVMRECSSYGYCQLKRKLPRFQLLKALPATNNQEVTAQ